MNHIVVYYEYCYCIAGHASCPAAKRAKVGVRPHGLKGFKV